MNKAFKRQRRPNYMWTSLIKALDEMAADMNARAAELNKKNRP